MRFSGPELAWLQLGDRALPAATFGEPALNQPPGNPVGPPVKLSRLLAFDPFARSEADGEMRLKRLLEVRAPRSLTGLALARFEEIGLP